ncbi:MAG: CPBP family intramembrane metalloprotease [Myxococcales bacterium]|nr:CPBP family intramembrane metalloprotease [Myxococcales bacterium]
MQSDPRPKRIALALCIGAFCIAMGLREEVNIWVGTSAAATASIVLLIAVRAIDRTKIAWPSLRSLALGTGVGIAMSLGTWWLYPLSITLFPPIGEEVAALYALLRQPPGPIQAFPLLLLVVSAEELVWRGLAIDMFSETVGSTRAVVVSALLYVLPQVAFRSPLLMIVALLCGIVWGMLRVGSKGLAAPFAAHVIWDLLVFVIHPVA